MSITFEKCISEAHIIDSLVSIRLRRRAWRHKRQMMCDISRSTVDPSLSEAVEIDAMMPPRRLWDRIRPMRDMRAGNDYMHRLSILAVIRQFREDGRLADQPWGRRLLDTVEAVKAAVTGKVPCLLEPPRITFADKDPEGRTLRAITCYDNLVDKVVISLTARYLRKVLDPHFTPHSHAFRADHRLSHHSAAKVLVNYRDEHRRDPIYVAECDIRKFFDCVDQSLVDSALVEFCRAHEVPLEPQVWNIVRAFLASYEYRQQVLSVASLEQRVKLDAIGDEELREFYDDPSGVRLGLPQGGAISNVLANVLMDKVDHAVFAGYANTPLGYVRFCDDMVLMHTERAPCQEALDRYLAAVRSLRLLVHPPQEIQDYGPDFFNVKSKLPYAWGPRGRGSSPWVPFVGYQVRWNGVIRVRRVSVKKEMDKQRQMVDRVLAAVRKPGSMRLRPRQVLQKVENRLTAMGIGFVIRYRKRMKDDSFSWMDGFYLLCGQPHLTGFLRRLDHTRQKQLVRLRKRLVNGRAAKSEKPGDSRRAAPYGGHPFSYFGCFDIRRKRPGKSPQPKSIYGA